MLRRPALVVAAFAAATPAAARPPPRALEVGPAEPVDTVTAGDLPMIAGPADPPTFLPQPGQPAGAIACADAASDHMRQLVDTAAPAATVRDPVDLAVGHDHGCAVDGAGQPWCWGSNFTAQLGVDGEEARPLPVRAGAATLAGHAFPPLLARMGPVVELAVGSHHTCARHRAGAVSCWGRGTYGALGRPVDHPDLKRDRRLGPLEMPLALPVVGIDDATLLVDGQDFTCAVRADRSLWCWGDNHGGQLGDGTLDSRATPAPVQGLPGPVLAADGGRQHVCAIVGETRHAPHGALYCWGDNEHGQLGDGTRVDRRRPVRVRPPARGR